MQDLFEKFKNRQELREYYKAHQSDFTISCNQLEKAYNAFWGKGVKRKSKKKQNSPLNLIFILKSLHY